MAMSMSWSSSRGCVYVLEPVCPACADLSDFASLLLFIVSCALRDAERLSVTAGTKTAQGSGYLLDFKLVIVIGARHIEGFIPKFQSEDF